MKKVEHYVCEFCNTEYADKEKAEQCEKGHHKPVKIDRCKYTRCTDDHTGVPFLVFIEMDNGDMYSYQRKMRV